MDNQNATMKSTSEPLPPTELTSLAAGVSSPLSSQETQPKNPSPTKKSKKTLIFTLVSILIVFSAIAVFYFFYYAPRHSNTNLTQEPELNQTSESQTETTASVESIANIPETELTDESVKTLLFDRIFILHHAHRSNLARAGSYAQNKYFDFKSSYQVNENLYPEAALSNSDKLYIVTKYLETENQLEPIENFDIPADYYEQKFPESCSGEFKMTCSDKLLSENKVEQTFVEFFGEKPIHGFPTRICGRLLYDESYHVYAVEPHGCGGGDPLNHQLYVEKYTEKDNNAYVYIRINSIKEDKDPQIVYRSFLRQSDFYDPEAREEITPDESLIYSTIPDGQNYDYKMQIDVNNYQDFEAYRFVFQKAGTNYVFKRVEKL